MLFYLQITKVRCDEKFVWCFNFLLLKLNRETRHSFHCLQKFLIQDWAKRLVFLLFMRNWNIKLKVTYVAGDRVITDLLAKPFSMGKNLLCVNSKKHMV